MLFHQVPDAHIILASKGVYRQTAVFTRNGRLYAKYGSGFIGLRQQDNGTTVPNVRWEHVEGVEYVFEAPFGIMIRKPENVRKVA